MKYQIIHVELEDYETRLWRDIAISGNPTLMELSVIIGSSFQAEFDEQFFLIDDNFTYTSILGKTLSSLKNARLLNTAHLGDLDPCFSFIYDLHDHWVFNCEKKKEKLNKSNFPFAFVIDGYGQGLFECNKETFEAYMNGNIKPSDNNDSFLEDYEHDYDLPFNMNLTCFGDFEKPLNLNNMKYSKQEVKQTIQYIENREETIFDTDDDIWDDDFEDNDLFNLDLSNIEHGEEPTEEQLNKMLQLTRTLIAYEIFEDEDINKEYRRLNKKYDMNEVFDMITEATLSVMMETEDPESPDIHSERLRAIRKLK